MTEIDRARKTVRFKITDELEVMITEPNGRIRFMGLWTGFWFLVEAVARGFFIEDGE